MHDVNILAALLLLLVWACFIRRDIASVSAFIHLGLVINSALVRTLSPRLAAGLFFITAGMRFSG